MHNHVYGRGPSLDTPLRGYSGSTGPESPGSPLAPLPTVLSSPSGRIEGRLPPRPHTYDTSCGPYRVHAAKLSAECTMLARAARGA